MDTENAISVQNVSKIFKLPREKRTSVKSIFVNIFRPKKGYDLQRALNNVSFEIKKGEFFGIIGRNGSGKSTLLKLLAGIYSPTTGDVDIQGSLTPFIELGVGFNPELTGRENVFLNGSLLGFNRKEMSAMYEEIVAFAELEKFMDQKLKNYSSGMQVRLAFSIAIRAKSDILLVDEVLAVGDSAFQQKCFDYFYQLKNDHRTVVFVSHDMGAVERFCDLAIMIEAGTIKKTGHPKELVDYYKAHSFDNAVATKQLSESRSRDGVSDLVVKMISNKRLERGKDVELEISYNLEDDRDVELRVAVVKDGISIADINSRSIKLDSHKGKYHQRLKISVDNLMDGEHSLYCGVYDRSTGKELAYLSNAAQFYLSARDPERSGFLRLDASWIEKNTGKEQ